MFYNVNQHLQTVVESTLANLDNTKKIMNRADYQPQSSGLQASTQIRYADTHENKLFRYRDRLLGQLAGKIDAGLMLRIDERSSVRLGTVPQNTEIALYSDLCNFIEFCIKHQLAPFPVTEHALDFYLGHRMSLGHKRSTLDRVVSSLCTWHRWLELDDPRASFAVRARLDQIKQQSSTRSNQKTGLRIEHLQAALDVHNPDIPRDAADIALLFTAFESLGRRSELVRLNWDDLTVDPKDQSGLLHFMQSKTDQDKEGAYQYLSPVTVQLLEHWRKIGGQNGGAMFRGIYSDGTLAQRLSAQGVARCFKRIARRLQLPGELFAGHSTRIGAAQEMVEQDIDTASIMLAGRWKSVKMVAAYARKIDAKKSGMAKLTRQMGWQDPTTQLQNDLPTKS